MNNEAHYTTRLKAVRPGDMLTLQRQRFRVLTSQHDDGLITLELEDTPDHPITLIGVVNMKVTIETRH